MPELNRYEKKRIQDRMDEISGKGIKLHRRIETLEGSHDFLVNSLLDRPVKDMKSQYNLLREWEQDIIELTISINNLRTEWRTLKARLDGKII